MLQTYSHIFSPHADHTNVSINVTADKLTVSGKGIFNGANLRLPSVFTFPELFNIPKPLPLSDGATFTEPIIWEVAVFLDGTVHLLDTTGPVDLSTGELILMYLANERYSLGHLFFANGLVPKAFTDATVFHQIAHGPWDESVHGPMRFVVCHGTGDRDWYRLDGRPCDEQGNLLHDAIFQ